MSYGLIIFVIGTFIALLSGFADQILSTNQATATNPNIFGPAQISGIFLGVFIALPGLVLIYKFPNKKLSNDAVKNTGLCVGSISVTLLIIEFLIFPSFLHYIPIKFHTYLPEPIQVLAQSSKDGTIPRSPYILILGDSYAQGLGDWFLGSNKNINPPFHSAHSLHEVTNQDVISIGQGGAGSISSMVILPQRRLRPLLNDTYGISVDTPKTMIVYFYEGNDLNDNIQRYRRFKRKTDNMKTDEMLSISQILEDSLNESAVSSLAPTTLGRLLFFQFIKNVVFNFHFGWQPPRSTSHQLGTDTGKNRFDTNFILAAGKKTALRNKLQSPPIYLSKQELYISTKMFAASLRRLKKEFPETKLIVAYIPSVLMSYKILSYNVMVSGDHPLVPSQKIVTVSNKICNSILSETELLNVPLFDLRRTIQLYAQNIGIIHGDKDWEHFNKLGYSFLGKEIGNRLKDIPAKSVCDKIPLGVK